MIDVSGDAPVSGSDALTDLVTVEQFYALVEDGQKADLIDGVIYMASPDTLKQNRLTGFFWHLLALYCESKDFGNVFASRFAFVLSPHSAPEPDVAFVRKERLHLVDERGMHGPPDIAVEIVSRDSRHRDRVKKRRLYQESGVSEYWIIDPLKQEALFLRLKDGRYEPVTLEEDRVFRSTALPGFFVDVSWLFAPELPKIQDALRVIHGA
jgi:Uma2 family endonuclease